MTAASKLLTWRLAKGLTQCEAAEAAGVSQASWCNWERGKKCPGIAMAMLLERVTRRAVRLKDWTHASTVSPGATPRND
jgi:transcriptional regulator with XRE-family HTH domain